MFLLTIKIKKNEFIFCEFDNLENTLEYIKRISKNFNILEVTIEKIEKGDKN